MDGLQVIAAVVLVVLLTVVNSVLWQLVWCCWDATVAATSGGSHAASFLRPSTHYRSIFPRLYSFLFIH